MIGWRIGFAIAGCVLATFLLDPLRATRAAGAEPAEAATSAAQLIAKFVVLEGVNPMAQQFIEQDAARATQKLPGFGITLLTVLLPVLLMLVGSWADLIVPAKSTANNVLRLIGHPDMALASMGIYIFNAAYLFRQLEEDLAKHKLALDIAGKAHALLEMLAESATDDTSTPGSGSEPTR